MATHFRLVGAMLAASALLWAGAASAQWPFAQPIARLDHSYGGVCENCNLSGRILAGARMTNSIFTGADFSGAVLANADATGSTFDGADFSSADLSKAKLIHAHCEDVRFENALLTNADATSANFTGADFEEADLTGANLAGANLSGADLRRARGLTQDQLRFACGDRATRLPGGLRVARCR